MTVENPASLQILVVDDDRYLLLALKQTLELAE